MPEHCQSKSASALSRFLNQYNWSTPSIIRITRKTILERILATCPKGRRPRLQMKYHAVVGIRWDRKLTDGLSVQQSRPRGQQVQLVG